MKHYLERGLAESAATVLCNYSPGGLDPRGYKILPLLLHVGAGLALFALLLFLRKRLFSKSDPLPPFSPTIVPA